MDTSTGLTIRALAEPDLPAMTAFLAAHIERSMFLLGNARACGLEYSGRSVV